MPTPGPLLGGTANLGAGTATFARIAKVPIYPTIVTREGWTRHRIRSLPAVEADMTLDKQADIERMSAIVVNILDQEIQAAPEQWFWFNKRWILDPYVPSSQETAENGKSAEPIAGGT